MKKILIPLILLIILTSAFFWNRAKTGEKEIHYHAGFKVYIDGKLEDFSDTKYMDIAPCLNNNSVNKQPKNEQLEKAHLHDNIGDVVHVENEGAKWSDLFKNIHFSFPDESNVIGFEKSKLIKNFLSTPITSYQSVIIISGDSKNIDINKYVSIDHIKEIEKTSETCGS